MWNGEQKSDFIYSVTSFLSEIFPVSGKHVWTLCIEVPQTVNMGNQAGTFLPQSLIKIIQMVSYIFGGRNNFLSSLIPQ